MPAKLAVDREAGPAPQPKAAASPADVPKKPARSGRRSLSEANAALAKRTGNQPADGPARDRSEQERPEPPKKPARARLSVSKPDTQSPPPNDAPAASPQSGTQPTSPAVQATAQRSRQSLNAGALGGFLAAIVGALLWGVVTLLTGIQIGFMAIVVGVLVGGAVRTLGQGPARPFARIGAGLSLVGCLLGTFVHGCVLLAHTEEVALMTVFTHLQLEALPGLMITTFQPLDWLFYALALVVGYRLSFRSLKRTKARPASG